MATILAALLHDAPPQGLGPVRCVALGPAAVLSAELAEAAAPFTTSVILGRAPPRGWQLRCRPVLVKGELCMIAAPRLAAGHSGAVQERCPRVSCAWQPLSRQSRSVLRSLCCPRTRLLRSCDNGG